MSVAARSPHRSNKRHFEHSESPERYSQDTPFTSAHKRFRPAASRCVPLTERQPYVVTPTTVAALRGLFPDMDDKTIGDVLEACGHNIDVAIKQLGQLRLTAHAGAAQAPAGEPVTQQPAIAGPASTSAAGHQTPAAQAPAASLQQATMLKSPEEWVEVLVQQMAGARDMADARQRAAGILQSFEQEVLQTASASKQDATASSAARTQLAEFQHNNGILKRAVAIQNNRIQDLLAKEAESQQLKQALLQLQEKCHGLEMNNYSLAMHLKQATDSSAYSQAGQRHPDVY